MALGWTLRLKPFPGLSLDINLEQNGFNRNWQKVVEQTREYFVGRGKIN
jgi:hypothetical protein